MQVRSVVSDATTGEEWTQLESCWCSVLISIPVADSKRKSEYFTELYGCLCRYLDGISAERASALTAVRYDGRELILYWDEPAAFGDCNSRIRSYMQLPGVDGLVWHRHGSPFAASRLLSGEDLNFSPNRQSEGLAA